MNRYYDATKDRFEGIRGAIKRVLYHAWQAAFSNDEMRCFGDGWGYSNITSVRVQLLSGDQVVWEQERRPWSNFDEVDRAA